MIKQREESARIYEEAGRLDLAAQEREEIAIIRGYLPKPMSESEVEKAVAEAIGRPARPRSATWARSWRT